MKTIRRRGEKKQKLRKNKGGKLPQKKANGGNIIFLHQLTGIPGGQQSGNSSLYSKKRGEGIPRKKPLKRSI